MKHQHSAGVDVKLDIPTKDLEDLIAMATGSAVIVIVTYMAADVGRHILKTLIK